MCAGGTRNAEEGSGSPTRNLEKAQPNGGAGDRYARVELHAKATDDEGHLE